MKKSLLFGALLALVVVTGSPFASRALSLNDTSTEARNNEKQGSVLADRDERVSNMMQEVDAKRAEIEQRLAAKRAAIQEKLSGKRAESCEKKQASINQILDNRVSAASKHFDRFKAIQEKLVAFVETKALVVENAAALELIMNDAQASARAAIDAASATDFACTETDAAAPGKIVTEQVGAQKQALKNYRSAIKDYAVALKSSIAATKTETDGAGQ